MRYRSGLYRFDYAIGGGLTPGIVEYWGAPAVGKATLGLSYMREAERQGLATGLIHMDGLPDPVWVHNAGPAHCLVPRAQTGEEAFDSAYHMLRNGVRVLVIDSLAGMTPLITHHASFTDDVWNVQRKLIHHGLSLLRSEAKARGALVILLNQVRHTLVEGRKSYLHDTVSALVDHRIMLWRDSLESAFGTLKKLDVRMQVEFIQRRTSDLVSDYVLWPADGVWPERELLEFLTAEEVLTRHHTWWATPAQEKKIGPGFDGACAHIARHYDYYYNLMEELFRCQHK